MYAQEHSANVRQTCKYDNSNDKEKHPANGLQTFNKRTTIICKQLQTFKECFYSVSDCLCMFENHLLNVSVNVHICMFALSLKNVHVHTQSTEFYVPEKQ